MQTAHEILKAAADQQSTEVLVESYRTLSLKMDCAPEEHMSCSAIGQVLEGRMNRDAFVALCDEIDAELETLMANSHAI